MGLLDGGFDPNATELGDTPEFRLLPAGEYAFYVADVEERDTAKGGRGANIKLEIIEPVDGCTRFVWDWLNTDCASEKAMDIAKEQLARMCLSAGVENLTDLQDLIGKTVTAKVKVERSAEYGDKNRVAFYVHDEPQSAQAGFKSTTVKAARSNSEPPF